MNCHTSEALILIADDNHESLSLLAEVLKPLYRVVSATCGLEALGQAKQQRPDLIVLDAFMPDLDGFAVCEQLHQQENFKDIPIIFLSGSHETQDRLHGFAVGAVDFVSKPFHHDELLSRIRTHLALKHSHELIEEKNQQLLKMNRQLDHIIGEQKELLHVLCHDLNNPFSAIIGLGQVILENPANNLSYLRNIISAATKGNETIELIRKIRALEHYTLPLEPVNLGESLLETKAMLIHRFEHKRVKLEIDLPHSLHVKAESSSLINSVLGNLLTNSLKFSYPSSAVSCQGTQQQNKVTLAIQDQGIGIPANMLSRLFDITATNQRPGTMGEPGTGFGMPLVKKFMDCYQGQIQVASVAESISKSQHGTTFTLTFDAG